MNKLLPIFFILSLSSLKINAQEVTQSIRLATSHGLGGTLVTSENLKKNDLGEYFMLFAVSGADFYIGQDTFLYEPIPNSDEEVVTYLIKLSSDLDVMKVVPLRGVTLVAFDLSISENRVFVGDENSERIKYIGDQLLEIPENKRGLVHEFDHELNYLGTPVVIKQRIKHIAAFSDSILYINAKLKSIDTLIFNSDTLFNFINSNGHSQWETNSIINYNYLSNEVKYFWKYGSLVDDTSVDLEVDSDGDIYVASTFGWWIFSIDGETEIDNIAGSTDCIIKFNPEGEVIWSTFDPWHNITELNKIYLLENEEVLGIYEFSSSQHLSITGDTIFAQTTPNSPSTKNLAFVKYDNLGNLSWLHYLDGVNLSNEPVYGIDVYSDTIEVLNFINNCDTLTIGDTIYTNVQFDQAFIYLDLNTGKELDGYIIENESNNISESIRCYYQERINNSNLVTVVYAINNVPFDLYGQSWGTDGNREQYILELNGVLLSQVNLPHKDQLFSLYPNPVIQNSDITIEIEDSLQGHWRVYNAQGEEVRSLSHTQLIKQNKRLNVDGLDSGAYFLQIQTGLSSQTQIFIIQ